MEKVFGKADALEKKYDWVEAADLHKQALREVGKKDFSRRGAIQERIGYCLSRAAFQAETQEDFKSRIKSAVGAFEKASASFDNVEDLEKLTRTSHCKAMAAYANSWISPDASRKKELLDDCWRLEQNAIATYEGAGDQANAGKVCNRLMACLIDRLNLEWDADARERIVEDALEYGERAMKFFSKSEDKHQLARTYVLKAFFHENAAFARGFKTYRREECRKKALSYPKRAIEISEEIGDAYLVGLANLILAAARLDIMGSSGLAERPHYEKALECGSLVRDHLLIADALFGLEYATSYSAMTQEDPDKAREEYRMLDEYRKDAVDHYNIIAHDAGIAYAHAHGIRPIEQRSAMETNLKSKRQLIEESVKLGYKGLEHARLSGSIGHTFHMTRALGIALVCLARVETNADRKRVLLEESSKHIEESIDILEQASACGHVEPREGGLFWCFWFLALNEVELASIEEMIDEKTRMLKDAITNMRSSREYALKWHKSPWARVEKRTWFILGRNAMILGKTLSQLYTLTHDINDLGEAIDAFQDSVKSYGTADSPFSRVAESYWELARAYHEMGNYPESAKNFKSASENYVLAAKKIPQLKDFYQDHASYMEAWSEIEKARHHHARNEYEQAREHFQKAAELHKSTERWTHLAPNYLAWVKLEEAEDLSRREQAEEARDLFQQAAELFVAAEKAMQPRLEKIESKEEKESLVTLAKAMRTRARIKRQYCRGRIALEEAKILDRQGDHAASSRKYGSAVEKFQKALDATKDESDRQELEPVIRLSQAWEMMTRAEAEASPDLYKEASKLFEEAKAHSPNEQAKMLALGHSSFCKALEAGTRFEAVRDASLHKLATRHLEGAASYYLRAGFKNASEYAEATQQLLDAYLYMHHAKTETDPVKKARLCMMAEKVLQASAGSYLKAKHPEKQEQVSRLLEKVRRERELALSLTEILHAPLETATTASFTTPTPGEETPIGLERFEHADVQASLIVRVKEVRIGDDLSLEIELVNVGKAPALLIKIEEVIPKDFQIKKGPDIYKIEDGYLNMKGKSLAPLKTEEIRLILKPATKGTFILKPRILYLDETGKYKSHEPEPSTITVKELGISGWLKGPSR
jgi:tetratricopeptide (TPR) repeat protein